MRKTINISIIAITTILAGLTQYFLFPYAFIFFWSFNIISLIMYRETPLMVAWHITRMLLITGFFVTLYGLFRNDYSMSLLFMSFMDAGAFVLFLISFGIILQNKTTKRVERFMMVITIFYIIFYTMTRWQIIAYIEVLFSPVNQDIQNGIYAFIITNYVLIALIGLIEIYLVTVFDGYLDKRIYLEKKRIDTIDKLFY